MPVLLQDAVRWASGVSGFRRWRLALNFNLSRVRDSAVRFLLIVRSERRHCTHVPHANSRGARPSSKKNIGESFQRDATCMGNRLFKAHTAATKLMHRIPASTRLSSLMWTVPAGDETPMRQAVSANHQCGQSQQVMKLPHDKRRVQTTNVDSPSR